MRIVNTYKAPTTVDTPSGEQLSGPSAYVLVLADVADNEYEVLTNKETFEAVESINSLIEDASTRVA